MKGGKYQMAGDRSAHGNGGCLRITGFTHHDDIRILAQQGAQSAVKGQPGSVVYLHLIHSGQVFLHRVLDGGDVDLALG